MIKSKEIWLVDDDFIFCRVIEKTILKIHITNKVVQFQSPEQAFDELEKRLSDESELPEIIFLDINMPGMDGWQFLESVSEMNDRIKNEIQIFISSSSVYSEDIDQAKTYPFIVEYLIKPISKEKIIQILET